MTTKVRSSTGDFQSNLTTIQLDSPATISVGDRLVASVMINASGARTITPPTGFVLDDQVSSATQGTGGSRFMQWSKLADATDVTNQGVADYYDFSGFVSTDDLLYSILALHDDAGGTIAYVAGSLGHTENTGGGTASSAPGATITVDGSLLLGHWAARDGTAQWPIDTGETYAPTGGDNPAFLHAAHTANVMSGTEWVITTAEFDIDDSPVAAQSISHDALASNVDVYAVTSLWEASIGPAVVIDSVAPGDLAVVFDNEIRVEIDGSNFGASGAVVKLHDTDPVTSTPAISVTQTIRTQSDTLITFDVDQGALSVGTVYLGVTPVGDAEGSFALELKADPGALAVGKRADPTSRTIVEGTPMSFDAAPYLFASDVQDKLSLAVAGLPAGLAFDGVAAVAGTVALGANTSSPYTVTVDCTDLDGNAAPQDSYTLTINAQAPPSIFKDRRAPIRTQRFLSTLTGAF